MKGAPVVAFVALLIVLSGMMPWFELPFGGNVIPIEVAMDFNDLQKDYPLIAREISLPISAFIFLFTWAGAAILIVTGFLLNWAPRLLAMLTGTAPFAAICVFVVEAVERADRVTGSAGFDLDRLLRSIEIPDDIFSEDGISLIYRQIDAVLMPGGQLFFAMAFLMLFLSFFLPGRSWIDEEPRTSPSPKE